MPKSGNRSGKGSKKKEKEPDADITPQVDKSKQTENVEESKFFGCFGKKKSTDGGMDLDDDKAEQMRIKALGENNMTPQQKERAQKNWRRLKQRVKEMREQPNFLVMFLDERDEMIKEKMEGYDQNNGDGGTNNGDTQTLDNTEKMRVPCLNIIIQPQTSSWYGFWKGIVYLSIFYGYVIYPIHIGFVLSELNSDKKNRNIIVNAENEREMELILDVIFSIDIILMFITAFQKDGNWQPHIFHIGMNYAKGTLVFDLASTLPSLITGQSSFYYPSKLIRFIHVKNVYGFISDMIKLLFTKMGFNSAATEKMAYIFNLNLILFSAIHILASMWIYLGKTVENSWIDGGGPDGPGYKLDNSNSYQVYITAFYWVITTLTTVGYGDYRGYTSTEYVFQMFVEFMGIGVFSFLMNSINSLFGSETQLLDIIDRRIEDVETWLRNLEKRRNKNLTKQMFDSVKVYTEQAYYFDYHRIYDKDFFAELKPRIKHRLIQSLFAPFISNFYYMFKDSVFEAGCEFKNDFLSNIYSRLYLPKNDVINFDDNFSELIMIQQGVVNVYTKYKDEEEQIDHDFHFFVLPTFSYMGDYQILFDLKSQLAYKADKCSLLVTLCIKKKVFLNMIEDYPEARRFYMERAWQRRIEFRRRQKKFISQIREKVQDRYQDLDSDNESKKNASQDEEIDDDDSVEENANLDSDTEKIIKDKKKLDAINDGTKFFFDIDIDQELKNDFDDEELEKLSDDEINHSTDHLLYEDYKGISQMHTEELQKEMDFLIGSFSELSSKMGSNLSQITDYIKKLQENQVGEQQSPELIQLTQIVENLRSELFEKMVEVEEVQDQVEQTAVSPQKTPQPGEKGNRKQNDSEQLSSEVGGQSSGEESSFD